MTCPNGDNSRYVEASLDSWLQLDKGLKFEPIVGSYCKSKNNKTQICNGCFVLMYYLKIIKGNESGFFPRIPKAKKKISSNCSCIKRIKGQKCKNS